MAHERGSVTPQVAVSFQESVEQAGEALFDSWGVNAVGDGAPWIADQVEVQFGAQGHYRVDFYQVCEYLGNAAPSGAGKEKAAVWFEKYQMARKNGHVEEVIEALQPHLETSDREDTKAPICFHSEPFGLITNGRSTGPHQCKCSRLTQPHFGSHPLHHQ